MKLVSPRLIALLLSFAACALQAQTFNPDTLNIPATHPRILFTTAADLARARTWYSTHTISPPSTSAIHQAYVGLMTQTASNCRTAINLVLNDPEYQLSPQLPIAVASDAARWIGEEALVTYDWCHAHFTTPERDTFKSRWNNWVSILNAKPWGGEGMEDNNYFWGYMRNSILWGIASWGENTDGTGDRAREFLMHGYATRFLNWMVSFHPRELAGGVPPEGTAYGRVMFDYHLLPFLTLRSLGEDPFARIRFWKESVYYTAYSMTPARTAGPTGPELCPQAPVNWTWQQFPFADDERFSQCDYEGIRQADYSNGMLTYANIFADRDSGKLARLIRNTVNQSPSPWLRAYFADTTPASNFAFTSLPLDYFAPASRSVYTRNAWSAGTSSLVLSLGRSPSAGHKHFDGGSFQWWRNGRWVSRESTGYVGSGESVTGLDGVGRVDVDNAVAHNTVLFEGKATINGEDGLPEGNAQMLRLFANPDFLYGAADLAPSFRYRLPPNPCRYDWPYAQNAVREFVYLRAIETLVMIDRLTGSGDSGTYPPNGNAVNCFNNFTGVVRTPAQVRRHVIVHGMETFTQSGGWYLSNSGAERLAVRPLAPASRTVTVINERNAATGGGAQGNVRLDIGASGAATIEFVTVIHASASSGALPTVSLDTVSTDRVVNINHGGVDYAVRFQPGVLPQSTMITINGVAVTPPATVAPLTPAEFNIAAFDIDGNGSVDAPTDGVMILRHLLGITGNALVNGVLGSGATRQTAADITTYLNGLQPLLDIDGDGQRRAATDGLLITRYLRGMRGATLLLNATNGSARTPAEIEQLLQTSTVQ